MALFQARVDTPRAPSDVFERLADFSSVGEWDPGVVRAERVDAGPLGVGSLFDVAVRFLGRELELRYAVLIYDPPRRIVLEAEGTGFRSHDVIRVCAVGAGSRVEYDAELTFSTLLRAFDPALQLVFDRLGRDAARGLARYLGGSWREEREGRTLVPCVWTAREIDAPAEEVWKLLVDLDRWTDWGPSIAEVDCEDRILAAGSSGRVRPVYGPWLPFEVDGFRDGSEWSWRVAGLPSTRHRVNALGARRCRVEFGVPLPAAPYLPVCRAALDRIEAIATRPQSRLEGARASAPGPLEA